MLTDRDATRARVLKGLTSHTWIHFSCHASTNATSPSSSHLVLYDHPLAVRDIAQHGGIGGELAYLSACSTARGGSKLADEAIHIAGAFQLAGYTNVIASLWPVLDSVAVKAADLTYASLGAGDGFAHAVHATVLRLRDSNRDRPERWASLIHSGP